MVKKVSARGLMALAVLLLWGSGVATAQSWKKERENRKEFSYRFWKDVYFGVSGGWGFRLSPTDFNNSPEGFGGQSSYRFSASVGKWIRPSYALQVSYQAGEISHFDRQLHAFSMDALWDVCASRKGYHKAGRRFRFVPFAGLGVMFSSAAAGNYSLLFSSGAQGRVRAGRCFEFFGEVRGQLTSDRIFYQASAPSVSPLFALQAGIAYTIPAKKRPTVQDVAPAPWREEVNRLSRHIAELQDEVSALRDSLSRLRPLPSSVRPMVDSTARMSRWVTSILEGRMKDGMYMEVRFPKFSYFLGEAEKKNMARVAEWVRHAPDFDICVSAFGEGTGDVDFGRALSQRRTNAILEVLVKECGVPADKIHVLDAQAAGIPAEGEAFIFFIPSQAQDGGEEVE